MTGVAASLELESKPNSVEVVVTGVVVVVAVEGVADDVSGFPNRFDDWPESNAQQNMTALTRLCG